MNSVFKFIAGTIALIIMTVVFPFVRSVYELADNNGTGILYISGGTTENNGFIQFLPVLLPMMIVAVIIIYVVRKEDDNQRPMR